MLTRAPLCFPCPTGSAREQPIEAGGILVHPGNLVCGDDDGVVVVPREQVEQTVALALEKVAGETRALTHLQAGG